jgi:hypothetical protein
VDEDESPPELPMNLTGRRCGRLDFSKGAAHSCCIDDKTKQIPSLWAYSTTQWLRRTTATTDRNKARWPTSPLWEAAQQATFFGDGVPAVRERKTAGDLLVICQMRAGCSTTASALLTNALPSADDGTRFLIWFMTWLKGYLEHKGMSYEDIAGAARLKLGVVAEAAA